jgi:hypothetical protein
MQFMIPRYLETKAPAANLFDEIRKARGMGEVQAGAGLRTVTVTAGYRGQPDVASECQERGVLRPGAQAIQLEGVDPAADD